jgi:hypothetical protein
VIDKLISANKSLIRDAARLIEARSFNLLVVTLDDIECNTFNSAAVAVIDGISVS